MRRLHAWVYLIGLACLATVSQAGQFSVNPVRVELSPANAIAALKVTNQGDQPVTLQVRTFSWSQENGKDVVMPSRDILASPPIFNLAPGAEQIVRAGLRANPAKDLEQTYRIVFEEVLPPPAPDFRGLRIALNISIPVFVSAGEELKALPQWRVVRTSNGVELQVSNQGKAHYRISQVSLISPSGRKLASLEGNFYVLPGSARSWPIKLPTPPLQGAYRLDFETDAGKASIEKTLE